jgi:Protein of unknown function with HXXEE motif
MLGDAVDSLTPAGPVPWLCLAALIYVLHVFEEFWAGTGFSLKLSQMRGINLTPKQFLTINLLAFLFLIVSIVLCLRLNFPSYFLVVFGAVALVNALLHTVASIRTTTYNPGLITGLLLFVPFGVGTFCRFIGDLSVPERCTAIALSFGIYIVISLIANYGRHCFGGSTCEG